MSPEYAAANGGQTNRYNEPRNWRVIWYDDENERQEQDFRSRDLALKICELRKGSTMRSLSV